MDLGEGKFVKVNIFLPDSTLASSSTAICICSDMITVLHLHYSQKSIVNEFQ